MTKQILAIFSLLLLDLPLCAQTVEIDTFDGYECDSTLQARWIATQEGVVPVIESNTVKSGKAAKFPLQFSGTNPGSSIEGRLYERTVARFEREYRPSLDLSDCDSVVFWLYIPDKEIIHTIVLRFYSPAGMPVGNNYYWTWIAIRRNLSIFHGWNRIVISKRDFEPAGTPVWDDVTHVLFWVYEFLHSDSYVVVDEFLGKKGCAGSDRSDVDGIQLESTVVSVNIVGERNQFTDIYSKRMVSWTAYGNSRLFSWEERPNCKRYVSTTRLDGSGERPIRSCANIAFSYALLSQFWNFEGRGEIERNAITLIRYLTFTHVTGTETCADGNKWSRGENRHVFKTEWQSAWHASRLGLAAWIVWDNLDVQTQRRVVRIVVHEADRLSCIKPPSNKIGDTKAEENAFNSVLLTLAANMLGNHPRVRIWDEAAKWYLMNVHSVAKDRENNTLSDGKPVKEWVVSENCHPDFTLENHGRISSGYLVWSLHLRMQAAIHYLLGGNSVPEAASYHVEDVYRVCRQFGTSGNKLEPLMGVLFDDKEAKQLEYQYIQEKYLLKRNSYPDGRFHGIPEPGSVWESESLSYVAYNFLANLLLTSKRLPLN